MDDETEIQFQKERDEEWEEYKQVTRDGWGEPIYNKKNVSIRNKAKRGRRRRLKRELEDIAGRGQDLRINFPECRDFYYSRVPGEQEIEVVKRIQRGLKSANFENVFGQVVEDELKGRNLIQKVIEFEASILDDYKERKEFLANGISEENLPEHLRGFQKSDAQEAAKVIIDMAHKFASTKVTEATISQDTPNLEELEEGELQKFLEMAALDILELNKNGKPNSRIAEQTVSSEQS